ncbi:hypothetical protein [uncultured Mucilaginibacter sp.]|uniref:hypothetical protein n=1 Tax=uncultured Mucilaginibacter sp. TaxID=797541 RepID=UPI0025F5B1C6|nr:hypothetical protein [uncultured Mucilaginibacter sp.]
MQTNEQNHPGYSSKGQADPTNVEQTASGVEDTSDANKINTDDRPVKNYNANAADDQPWVETETQASSNDVDVNDEQQP